MNTTTLLLIVIAVLVLRILYLQMRLSLTPPPSPPAVIVTAPVVDRGSSSAISFALMVLFLTFVAAVVMRM